MGTLTLKSLHFSAHHHPILNDVSLEVEEGDFVVLVGPSGCGKSTLLRLIAGLDEPGAGEILINGVSQHNLAPAKRNIAMVFQQYALYPHMRVRENMAYCLKLKGASKAHIENKIAEVSKILQLEPYLNRYPSELSGGQKQRVAMGRAIIRQPTLFLFDEPLSNLDTQLRNELRHEIKKLHQTLKTTTLYVTHDYVEAMTLGHKIVVMNQGRIEQVGTPSEIFHKPHSRFVAEFLGHYPMNFLNATLDEKNHCLRLASGAQLAWPTLKKAPKSDRVWVGIRPEYLSLGTPQSRVFSGAVTFIDKLGAEILVEIDLKQGEKLKLKLPEQSLESLVDVDLDLKEAHVFCQETSENLGGWCG